jgi:N-acetylglucosamine malate deacetylase 1
MKLEILVLAAHPDDAELCCGGTIARHVSTGHKVGIVDFT